MLTELITNEDSAMKKAKSRIELFKRGGEWVAYFNNIKGMPRSVITTPFKSSEPFEVVRNSIKLSNPQCNVVWWSYGRGDNVIY